MLGGHVSVTEPVRLLQTPRKKTAGVFVKERFVDPVKVPMVCQVGDDRLVLNCSVMGLVILAVTFLVMIMGDGGATITYEALVTLPDTVVLAPPPPLKFIL